MKQLPMRVLIAVAPSGGEIRFVKFSDANDELAYYHGVLTGPEDAVWWRAKLAAQRAGVENWQRAIDMLMAAGWTVRDGD